MEVWDRFNLNRCKRQRVEKVNGYRLIAGLYLNFYVIGGNCSGATHFCRKTSLIRCATRAGERLKFHEQVRRASCLSSYDW